MTVQEEAFRAYYASLPDAQLLQIAANKGSFLAVAQQALAQELQRRKLVSSEPPPSASGSTGQAKPE